MTKLTPNALQRACINKADEWREQFRVKPYEDWGTLDQSNAYYFVDELLRVVSDLTAQVGDTEGGAPVDAAHVHCPACGQHVEFKFTEPVRWTKTDAPAPRAEAAPDEIADDTPATIKMIMGHYDKPAPMGVNREGLAKWFAKVGNCDLGFSQEFVRCIRDIPACACAGKADALIASGIVGKAPPSEEEIVGVIDSVVKDYRGPITDTALNKAVARAILNHIKGNAA